MSVPEPLKVTLASLLSLRYRGSPNKPTAYSGALVCTDFTHSAANGIHLENVCTQFEERQLSLDVLPDR